MHPCRLPSCPLWSLMLSKERLRLATPSTPSCGFSYNWKPEPPFKITWSPDIFDALNVDRLMQCVLSLCMWSVFGLCAVRHRKSHQWGSRRGPSWQKTKQILLSLQITVCVHVMCECVCRHRTKCPELIAADCFPVWYIELEELKENVTLYHGHK